MLLEFLTLRLSVFSFFGKVDVVFLNLMSSTILSRLSSNGFSCSMDGAGFCEFFCYISFEM